MEETVELGSQVRRTILAKLVLVTLLSASNLIAARGQVAPGPSPSAPSPAVATQAGGEFPNIKSNVDEVLLDLSVRQHGRDGAPKLAPEDLVVTDEGTPVRLHDLHLVNVLDDPARKPLITILFDPFHGPIARSTRILAQKLLGLLPSHGLRVAVMDMDGRLRLIQGFTEDRAAVQRAVQLETDSNATVLQSTLSLAVSITNDDKAEAAKKVAVSQAEKDLIAIAETGSDAADKPVPFEDRVRCQALLRGLENADSIAQQQHVDYSVAALLSLVNAQESLRGRRVIIYFTANRHLGPASDRLLKSVADTAAAAGINIYTIDMNATGRANGSDLSNAALNGNTPTGKQASAIPAGINSGTAPNTGYIWTVKDDVSMMTDFMRGSGEDQGDPFEDLRNPLQGVSRQTGGAYIDALNGTNRALRDLAEDLTRYYEATFVPATKEYDGKFRKITIQSRQQGLAIRGRSGYFALPPGVDPGLKPFELPMMKLLEQPSLAMSFPFRAAVLRFGELPDGNTNTLAVEVPLASLGGGSPGGQPDADARVSILAQVRDASGFVVDHFAQQAVIHGPKKKLEHDPSAVLTIDHHFISAPGQYQAEVVVRDESTGKMSAQRAQFDVAAQPGALAISDIAVVRELEPVSVVDLDPLEPLLFSRNKVTPELNRTLQNSRKGPSVFFLLHPNANSKDGLNLEMQLVRNGIAGKRVPMMDLYGVKSAVPYMAYVGSRPLPPGNYDVRAYLTQDGKTVEQSKSFVIAGDVKVAEAADIPEPVAVADDDSQIAVDSDNNLLPATSSPPMTLPVPPVPLNSKVVPPVDESRALLEDARRHAMDYASDVLSRFICTEVTQRSIDRSGNGRWRLEDTITERLEYRNNAETRSLIKMNGKVASGTGRSLKGTSSTGEFGGILRAVFRPAAQAAFTWKGSAALNGAAVQVYAYNVSRQNSDFSVTGADGTQTVVGFHGQVFIDKDAGRVRRISLVADDLPATFRTRSSSMSVDYDYLAIHGLRYLLPVRAQLEARQGDHEAILNTMQFSDFRRADARP